MASEAPRELIVSPDEMETIEIGLVVIDLRTLETVELFQRYVRPVLHPTLTTFNTRLTSIKQSDVETAKAFPEVAMEVSTFLQKYSNAVWGSWGHYDADQLAADARRSGCTPILAGIQYLDLEQRYRGVFACPSIGLRQAVEALGLVWSGRYHRGIDDAKNLANMVALLLKRARRAP
jgi:inhibitor of KinA sporulation pathway (predicted exonuclease)